MHEVRETNFCRISAARRRAHRQDHRLRHDRQPLEGHVVAGGAEPEPDVRPRRERGAVTVTFSSRWVEPPGARRPSAGRPAGRLPRRRRRRAASSRRARPTSACSSARRRHRRAPRASPAPACSPRRSCSPRSAASSTRIRAVVANSGNANAATGRRGLDEAARMQGAARWPPACPRTASRSPRPASSASSSTRQGHPRPRGRAPRAARRRRRRLRRRDPHDRRVRQEAPRSRSRCPAGTVRLSAQAKGAGMIPPAFATMLCFVQTDAALEPETADLLLGVCVKRSFDRISVDGQLSTNDTAILMALGRQRRHGRARERGRAALRRGARRAAAPARAADRRATARARRGSAASSSRGGHERRRRARRPRGRRTRRWSRPRCTAATRTGAGSRRPSAPRCPAPRRCRSTSRSRASRSAARRRGVPYDDGGARRGGHRRGGRVRGRPARRGRRDRGLLLRPLARVRHDQRGVHDVMRDVETLLEALPYIREFHGRTVVIKYGGAAMNDPALREDFARDVVLLKYVGLNPIVVHGGGPEITAYMERLDLPVEFVGGLRVERRETVEVAKMVLVGKVNKDIVLRINRHGQPAVGLCGDDGLLFRVARMDGPGRRGHRLRRPHRARRRRRAATTSPRTTSRSSRRSAPTATGARTTSTPTRPPAPSRARWAPTRSCSSPTSRAGCATRPTPTSVISETTAPTRSRPRSTRSPAGCGRSSRPAWTRSTAACSFAHIVDGRVPHSLLLELFTDAGIGTKIRPARLSDALAQHLRALPRRVRARRGRAAVGRRGQRVPRLPHRHLGLQRRATATRRSSRPCRSRPGG